MNKLLHENCIAVKGKDNALKVANTLLEQDYQVFIQLDDCNIYIVDFAENDLSLGSDRFALLTAEETELITDNRELNKLEEAKKLVKEN